MLLKIQWSGSPTRRGKTADGPLRGWERLFSELAPIRRGASCAAGTSSTGYDEVFFGGIVRAYSSVPQTSQNRPWSSTSFPTTAGGYFLKSAADATATVPFAIRSVCASITACVAVQ